MPKSFKILIQLSLAVLLASSSALGLVARQTSNLTSGSYTLGAISVPGFNIGAISGSYVGVEDPTNLQPADYTFDIEQHEQGYVIHLAAGYATASGGEVTLTSDYPGDFWNIVPVDGLYAIESTDEQQGWILPHDAPPGSPVSLVASPVPRIPAQYFVFYEDS